MTSSTAPKRCKVLFLPNGPKLAGAERCLINIAGNLDPNRFCPIVLVPAEGTLAEELRHRGIDTRIFDLAVLDNVRELKSPKLFLRLASLCISPLKLSLMIRREGIELVHSNNSGVLVGSLAAKLAGVPHIWHVREILEQLKWLWRFLQWVIPLLSRRVICISSGVRDHFRIPKALKKKIIIIPDAIDSELFLSEQDKSFALPDKSRPASLRVGMLARINPRKGHAIFIKAAKHVIERGLPAEFYMAGNCLPAYEDIKADLNTLIRTSGLDNQVHFLGDLRSPQVAAFIDQMDVVVLPSTTPEGFGLVLLEAMALAKPVIASDAGGPRDVVVPGVTGLLFPPGDSEALAVSMTSLLENESLRLKMGKAGQGRLHKEFGLRANVNAIEAVYSQVLNQHDCDPADNHVAVMQA